MHLSTTKLHLLLALVSALTLTTQGIGTAGLVLAVLGLRLWARHAASPAGAGVLAPAQHADLLHPTGRRRQALAGASDAVVQHG
jgi:hypothetical protein